VNSSEEDIERSLSNLQKFIKKIDGIESFVAISEGFPIAYSGTSQEKAETISAMAVDLILTGDELLKDIQNRPLALREILVMLDENKAIDVIKAKNLLLAFQGKKEIVEEVSSISAKYISREGIYCPYCGFNLILEVHKCANCKKNIPFKSYICPYCGTFNRIKKCIKCKNIITNDMKKVKIEKSRESKLSALLEGLASSIVFGWLGTITLSPVLGLILGSATGILVGVLAYRYIKPEYIVES